MPDCVCDDTRVLVTFLTSNGVDLKAHGIDEEQAAALAATLPHPRTSNPTHRPQRMLTRRNLILARYRGVDVYIPPEEETDSIPVPIVAPLLGPPPESLQVEPPTTVDTVRDTTTAPVDST